MLFSSPCNVESGKRNRRVKVTSCVEKGMDIKMVRGMKLQKDQISSVLGFAAVPAELYPTYHHQNLDSSWNGIRPKAEALTVPSGTRVSECVDFLGSLREMESRDGNSFSILDRLFVVDQGVGREKLVGHVTMLDLLLAEPDEFVENVSRTNELVLSIDDDMEHVLRKLRRDNVLIAPVVDGEEKLVGVLTASDMIRELEFEATDDLLRYGGVGGDEETAESYFGTSIRKLFLGRITWLVGLLLLQSLSSIVLGRYQSLIEANVVLALFLTMLTGTGGNAGNQSSALIIRGLATGEIRRENYARVVMKEIAVGISLSFVLAIVSFGRVYLTTGSNVLSSFTVSIAVFLTTVFAILGGTVAPMLLERVGVDPCNCASPALATLTDVGGVLILCSLASILLR